MTRQEKKILEKLDEATRDVTVPECLQPEQIQSMLEERHQETGAGRKGPHRTWYRYVAGLAAAAALVAGIGIASGTLHDKSGKSGSDKKAFVVANTMKTATDYSEVYGYIKSYQDEVKTDRGAFYGLGRNTQVLEQASDAASNGSMQKGANPTETSGTYSDTNVRTEGIGEADVVKTDGTYLYALKESAMEIVIVDALKDEMKVVSTIKAIDDMQIAEFYVDGTQLFVLGNVSKTKLEDGMEIAWGEDATMAAYDISDVAKPKLTDTVSQSGYYQSSRFANGYLYIFSNFYVEGSCKESDTDSYLPEVNGKIVEESDIYLPSVHAANQYVVVSSVNAANPGEIVDQKAVMSENGECYVSSENIYIYENTRNSVWARALFDSNRTDDSDTVIRRVSYKDGKLEGEAQGKIQGSIHDSFSIDEYEGMLRVVTTIYGSDTTTNEVYVLNEALETIGKIEGLAEDERVYSTRFFGETGYFVTYRETDPLFSVDFSDPTNPQIIGSLKIPGFSEYLHFYGDNMLLGIGMDTDENGATNGVKLSMFDISNPADVKEVQKYTIKGAYYSDVFNDYRAVLVDYGKNMIGFSCQGDIEHYYIFSYDKTNGFCVEMDEEVNGMSYMGTRGLYVGERFFVVKGNAVESYRIRTYEKIDDMLL